MSVTQNVVSLSAAGRTLTMRKLFRVSIVVVSEI